MYVRCRLLKITDYQQIFNEMRDFSLSRDKRTLDEIWFLQHYPVFSLGKNAKLEHILDPKDIPVIYSDRGGQVTYHAPGQLVVYFLIDLVRRSLAVKKFINIILDTVAEFLWLEYKLAVNINRELTGVYIADGKICSLGLKINKGCTYHGLSLNIDMDLEPFTRINPCGIAGLKMVQLSDFIQNSFYLKNDLNIGYISRQLKKLLLINLGYQDKDGVYVNN